VSELHSSMRTSFNCLYIAKMRYDASRCNACFTHRCTEYNDLAIASGAAAYLYTFAALPQILNPTFVELLFMFVAALPLISLVPYVKACSAMPLVSSLRFISVNAYFQSQPLTGFFFLFVIPFLRSSRCSRRSCARYALHLFLTRLPLWH
jgi:hypothetical protein